MNSKKNKHVKATKQYEIYLNEKIYIKNFNTSKINMIYRG